jgi:SAM-dependent methyltransferase
VTFWNWRRNPNGGASSATAVADDLPFSPQADVVFVPTPQAAVNKMLELAGAGPDDVVYDLGSGDGRIVITAARDFGVRKAVGVDINPTLVERSNKNAQEAGVADRVKFVEGSFFEFDFSEATVLTMYLLPSLNIRLRPQILELEPGTRVVSHAFDMMEWHEDDYARVEDMDVYLWIVPARIEGAWQLEHG